MTAEELAEARQLPTALAITHAVPTVAITFVLGSLFAAVTFFIEAKASAQGRKIVSELLAEALAQRNGPRETPRLTWTSRPMRARVDLADKEALYAFLEARDPFA